MDTRDEAEPPPNNWGKRPSWGGSLCHDWRDAYRACFGSFVVWVEPLGYSFFSNWALSSASAENRGSNGLSALPLGLASVLDQAPPVSGSGGLASKPVPRKSSLSGIMGTSSKMNSRMKWSSTTWS